MLASLRKYKKDGGHVIEEMNGESAALEWVLDERDDIFWRSLWRAEPFELAKNILYLKITTIKIVVVRHYNVLGITQNPKSDFMYCKCDACNHDNRHECLAQMLLLWPRRCIFNSNSPQLWKWIADHRLAVKCICKCLARSLAVAALLIKHFEFRSLKTLLASS